MFLPLFSYFCVLFPRPPPPPPLFPYTTLFRSRCQDSSLASASGTPRWRRASSPHSPKLARGTPKAIKISPGGTTDRKSTRLNSSHGYISYAVFCLKKKNHKNWIHLQNKPKREV